MKVLHIILLICLSLIEVHHCLKSMKESRSDVEEEGNANCTKLDRKISTSWNTEYERLRKARREGHERIDTAQKNISSQLSQLDDKVQNALRKARELGIDIIDCLSEEELGMEEVVAEAEFKVCKDTTTFDQIADEVESLSSIRPKVNNLVSSCKWHITTQGFKNCIVEYLAQYADEARRLEKQFRIDIALAIGKSVTCVNVYFDSIDSTLRDVNRAFDNCADPRFPTTTAAPTTITTPSRTTETSSTPSTENTSEPTTESSPAPTTESTTKPTSESTPVPTTDSTELPTTETSPELRQRRQVRMN